MRSRNIRTLLMLILANELEQNARIGEFPPNLIAYWPFDEASSGNGNTNDYLYTDIPYRIWC